MAKTAFALMPPDASRKVAGYLANALEKGTTIRRQDVPDFELIRDGLYMMADMVNHAVTATAIGDQLPDADADQTAANGERLCAECGNDFWGECPAQPRSDWRHEVANEDTSLGYWEWAAARIANDAPQAAEDDTATEESTDALDPE